MRYIVIGAGGVGGTIGGRLAQAGHDVVLVARGPHLGALRAQGGLRLTTPDGTSVIGAPAVSGPDEVELTSEDVLVLAAKTQDAEAAMAGWAWKPVKGGTVAAEDLPVVCAQNGVASRRPPWARSASRCGPRATRMTSCPAWASRPPMVPPTPPAPMTM